MSGTTIGVLGVGFSFIVVLGCSMSTSKNKPQHTIEDSKIIWSGSAEQEEHYIHNVMKATKGPWILEAWTDGSLYSSVSAISVGLRLTSDNVILEDNGLYPIEVLLESRPDKVILLTKKHEIRFWKKERERTKAIVVYRLSEGTGEEYFLQPGHGLETEIWDVFEMKQRRTKVNDGDYGIRLKLKVSEKDIIEVGSMPIQIRSHINK